MKMLWSIAANAAGIAIAAASLMAADSMELSLKRAVEIALSPHGNTRLQVSNEAVEQARLRSLEARASLLPDLSASFGTQSQTRNLEAFGIRFNTPIPGISFPRFVGPFNTMDARVSATQTIVDLAAIRRLSSSRALASSATAEWNAAAEQVAAQVSRAYLAVLRADADLSAARANAALSESVLKQAEDLKAAGTGTGIEITRARVLLANDRQRLLAAQNARRAAGLQLLRVMNLDLDTDVKLTGALEFIPVDAVTLEEAKARASQQRPDLAAQRQKEQGAKLNASAVRWERLPSLAAFGDYGSSGTGFGSALPTRTYGIAMRLPIFDGGRRDARRAESASQYRAEKVRTADLQEQIELDLRLAIDSLQSAAEQVNVAKEGLDLAESELAQARRRYEAGVSVTLEVTDAQTRLERARDNHTSALYNYNAARIDLAQAMGGMRKIVE